MNRKPTNPRSSLERARKEELESLRARLDEAEQTLEAIRSGKVDALVVSTKEGERVFTLQGADHRYRRIVEGMTEGAVIVSPHGIVLYANSSFAELVAIPLDHVLASKLSRYVPTVHSGTFERLLRDAARRTVTAEAGLLTEDERIVPVHVSAAADSDQPGAVCLIVTDLTGAMHEAEQRFQFVADMLPQIIWSARPDGWVDFYNGRWQELTGLTVAEAQGMAWERVLHAEDAARFMEAWRGAVSSGESFEVVARLLRGSDGTYRWHLARAIPRRNAEHEIVRWYGTFTDIEDERALGAEAERARDRAEQATRLKDEFLATLSHELRTPLTSILGWGRMLQSKALTEAKRERAVETIVRNAMAQNQLIDDLLDVSRIVSGKFRLAIAPVHVNQIIEAALDVVRPAADAKGVSLEPVLEGVVGVVFGDPARLQQVVWNLLANAVKFTPRGGRVRVSMTCEEGSVEIVVSDDGAGIAREFLPYVFDRFRQQDGAITRRAGGLGLGLSIVRNIVELHGGTVEAESDGEGAGSRFVVKLPITPARTGASSSPPPPLALRIPDVDFEVAYRSDLSGLKVLVVDDEPDARDLLKLVLEHCDAKVTATENAADALAAISRLRPDVIVSDIGMPDEDGYTFIRRLRTLSREEGGRTPAVALTAYARAEDRTRALMAGFQSHAAKPIDPQELLLVVANLAGRFS